MVGTAGMAFDGRKNIIDIDDEEHTVYFDTWKPKKITGTKIPGIFGMSEFSTPFKIACELARIYPGDKPNKYIDAGNILEPVLRDYLAKDADRMLRPLIGAPDDVRIAIEPPAEKELCSYDHFHDNDLFGGMVDGYVDYGLERNSILEIKTSGHRSTWLDDDGEVTQVPIGYMMQASLYAQLSGLDRIVFLVGFLEDADYTRPMFWKPTTENTSIIVKDRMDMTKYMADAEEWYKEYILNGVTPEWTDKDADVLKYIKAGFKQY
jgi:hypothetical protein